ncbi:MAG TPA: SprB repeat-containing protein, partial [Bacteroidia bacterium]|nr:SprB repeat-containing protein [Bacteroidia bacterium]
MLRKFPLVLAFILPFFIVSAQNNCPTCSNGTNSNAATPRTITNTQNIELLARNHPRVAPVPVYNTINVAPSIGLLNVCGLNWTAASVLTETRSISILSNTNGTGFPTSLTIGGIPANCYQIEQAYLYYEASYTEAVAPVTTATFTNPALATATLPSTIVATGPQKCWGEVGTATYRVDVTANIAGNGNYSVNLNGFSNAGYEVDGCTLIIVYIAGPTNSTTGNFALFDGDEVDNSSTVYSNIISFPAPCTATTAQAFVVIADAQAQAQPTHTDDFNAVVGTFNNNFWNFDQVNVPFTVATTSVTDIAYANNSADCWAWILEGLYWQNTGCVNCLPIIATTQVNPPCNGGVGSINATVTGGTPPYTYSWSNGGTNNSINGITAGTYTLTVEDVICNTAQVQVTLTQPTPLTANTTGTNSACG